MSSTSSSTQERILSMTSLLKQSVVDALNMQVVEEFTASMQYTAIALYFDIETLPELTSLFHQQAQEEHMHAMKLLQYITDAGNQSLVPATKPVKNHFESVEDFCRYVQGKQSS